MNEINSREFARGVFLIAVRSLMRGRFGGEFEGFQRLELSDVTAGSQQLGMTAFECVVPDSQAKFFGASDTCSAVVEKVVLPDGSIVALKKPYPLNFAEEPGPELMRKLLDAA